MDLNQEIIDHLEGSGVLRTPRIKKALFENPREFFVRAEDKRFAYEDTPLPIGYSQTISQPTTVVFMLELLALEKGMKVLEIGTGSGWQTAILAFIIGKEGQVFSFEIIKQLSDFALKNLQNYKYSNITLYSYDFEKEIEKIKPFDRIVSGAAFTEIPQSLKSALKIGGKLVAPTGDYDVRVITKIDVNKYKEDIFPGFVFVPITH